MNSWKKEVLCKQRFSFQANKYFYCDTAAVPEEFLCRVCVLCNVSLVSRAQVKQVWSCGNILTISDGVKSPLVILEEWVSLDFLHAVPAQSHLPQNKDSK